MVKSRLSALAGQAPHVGRNRILRVGYVPLCDSAPLIMARELGLFAKYGLRVQLCREVGWATVRDKIIYRELDAAHAVAGMVYAASLGLGSIPAPCLTALVLNLQGNAITLSEELWRNGVRDGATLAQFVRGGNAERPLTFGIVSPFSSHHFLLSEWLIRHGLDPASDVRIVVVPPPQVFFNLKAGYIDGYCSGEPWNSLAVLAGVGWCAATSADLAPRHPEKVLMVRRDFAEDRAEEHCALVSALLEACLFCDQPENCERIMETLADPQYVGAPIEALRMSLAGSFDYGHGRVEKMSSFNIFSREQANEPTLNRAEWVLAQMRACRLLPDPALIGPDAPGEAFRMDLFHNALALCS
jgi:ABC-type nitrate/sulfonate/bicarbonate transport system substrate-binding protein